MPKADADADDDDDDHGGSSLNCSTPGVAISLFRCVVFYELNTKAAKLACLKFWLGRDNDIDQVCRLDLVTMMTMILASRVHYWPGPSDNDDDDIGG